MPIEILKINEIIAFHQHLHRPDYWGGQCPPNILIEGAAAPPAPPVDTPLDVSLAPPGHTLPHSATVLKW